MVISLKHFGKSIFNANIHGILFFHIGNITKVILNQLFAVMKLKFQIFFSTESIFEFPLFLFLPIFFY